VFIRNISNEGGMPVVLSLMIQIRDRLLRLNYFSRDLPVELHTGQYALKLCMKM